MKGKVKIPALRSKISPKPKRVRRKKVEVEMEKKDKNAPPQSMDTVEEKLEDNNAKANDISLKSIEEKDTTTVNNANESVVKQVNEPVTDKNDIVKPQAEPETSLPEPELSNEILQSLDVSQSESENHHHPDHHHESLSPTAAFLLSFPVVSLAASRLTDVDPTDSNQLTDMPLPSKTSTQLNAGHSMLDNISSLFSCKEFDGSQPMSFDTEVSTCKKDQSKTGMPDLSFDFQLKPLHNSKTHSTNCLNSTIVTSEVKSNTSKMSNMFFEPIAPKSCSNFHSDPVYGRPTTSSNVSHIDTTFSFSLSTTIDTKPTVSTTNIASDRIYGFYDSLSAIGTSYKSNYSVMEPKLEFIPPPPPVSHQSSVKNLSKSGGLYPGRLPIVPSSNTNAIENLEYLPQTPFTFSLTTSVAAQPAITYDSSSKAKITNSMDSFLSTTSAITPMHSKYNPFAFDNIHSTSTATGSCSMPYVTSSDTSGFSFALTSVTEKMTTVRNSISQSASFASFPINYNILPEPPPVKFKQPAPPFTGIIPPPFNNTADVPLPSRTLSASHLDFNISTSSTTYPSLTNLDSKKVEPYFSHPSVSVVSADEHFPWSPNKMLDSSALPTLHGDLALNTISSSGGLHCDKKIHKRTKQSAKLHAGSDFAYGSTGGQHHSSAMQGSNNFLSVSNLVSEPKKSDTHHRQKASKSKGAHDNIGSLPTCSAEGYNFGGYNSNEQSASSVSRLHNNYSTESLISQSSKKYGGVGAVNSTDYYNTESSGTNYLYPNVSNTDYGNDSNYNYYNSNYLMGNGVSTDSDYSNMPSMYLSDQYSSSHNSKSNVSQRSSNRVSSTYNGVQKKVFSQDHMYPPPLPPPHISNTSIQDLSSQTGSHNSNSYHFVAPPPPPPPPPPPLPMANEDYLLPNAPPAPIINSSISDNYKNLYFHGPSATDNFSTGNGAVSASSSIGSSSLVTNFNLSTILS